MNKFNIVSNEQGHIQKRNFLEYRFWANLVQKIKIVSLSWNLEPTLSWIYRIQLWCEQFLFWTRNIIFGKTWSQNSKLFKVKFGTKTDLNMQNSLMMFTFFAFVWKYPFWLTSPQKNAIGSLSWNLVPSLISNMQNSMAMLTFFLFLSRNIIFG